MLPLLGRYSQPPEWVRLWGHYWQTYPTAVVVGSLPFDGWWLALTWAAIVVILFWAFVPFVVHEGHPCPQCIAAWPANASEMAQRRVRWLWYYHFGLQWGAWLSLLAGAVVILIFPSSTPARLVIILIVGSSIGTIKVRRMHDDLRPWCRWCRGRGKDEEEVNPTPTPSASL